MSKIRKALADRFPGDKNLARLYLEEVRSIRKSMDAMDRLSKDNFSIEQNKAIRIALAKAMAEIVSDIEIPIATKFPDLKNYPD